MSEPTDSERMDRLAAVMPRLIAERYNWRHASPFVARVAVDLAWQELQAEREATARATECGKLCGRFACVGRRGHRGRHRYSRLIETPNATERIDPAIAVDRSRSYPHAVKALTSP